MVAVALGLSERLSLMTESQPLAAVIVLKYVPALSRLRAPKAKVRPEQIDSDMAVVSIL